MDYLHWISNDPIFEILRVIELGLNPTISRPYDSYWPIVTDGTYLYVAALEPKPLQKKKKKSKKDKSKSKSNDVTEKAFILIRVILQDDDSKAKKSIPRLIPSYQSQDVPNWVRKRVKKQRKARRRESLALTKAIGANAQSLQIVLYGYDVIS